MDYFVVNLIETDVYPVFAQRVVFRDPAAKGSCNNTNGKKQKHFFRSTDKGVNHCFSRARDTANITCLHFRHAKYKQAHTTLFRHSVNFFLLKMHFNLSLKLYKFTFYYLKKKHCATINTLLLICIIITYILLIRLLVCEIVTSQIVNSCNLF